MVADFCQMEEAQDSLVVAWDMADKEVEHFFTGEEWV